MIKLKDELVNFPVINLEALSKNKKFPENVKTAVLLYNKALDRIKFNSTDIAMIELKKAIKLFPDFYDAILLLGLCHYSVDEKQKSISLLNTIRDDEERRKSFSYINYVVGKNSSGSKPIRYSENAEERQNSHIRQRSSINNRGNTTSDRNNQGQQRRRNENTVNTKIILKNLLNNPMIFRIMLLVVGFLFVVGLIYGIFTLYSINKESSEDKTRIGELEVDKNTLMSQIEATEKKYQELRKNNTELFTNYILDYLNELNVDSTNNYKTIVGIIYLLEQDNAVIPSEHAEIINMIKEENVERFTDIVYRTANNNYIEGENNDRKMEDAIKEYESIIKYCPKFDETGTVLLNLGRAYVKVNNKDKAIETFKKLINEYPNDLKVPQARNELAVLGVEV